MKLFSIKSGLACMLGAAFVTQVLADPPVPPLSPADKAEVLQTLKAKLTANYVFPDTAARLVAALAGRGGGYDKSAGARAFGERRSKDLRELGNDKHFRIFFDPEFRERATPDAIPSAEEMEHQRAEVATMAYGVEKVQRLPGNVAYVELRGFGPTELVAPAYAATMALVAGSDALILDLRRNGGGSPTSVALWMSYFFAAGDERHLNDIYTRSTGETQQFWTSTAVGERYAKPVYVLTSPRTFSGGEECAYDFQTQKRATLIGETTGGGANAGDRFALGHGLVVNIPTARAINPITHGNWEHVGVKPDVETPAADAQQAAYVAILKAQLSKITDPDDKAELGKVLALAEKGESPAPIYRMRP
jgi:hypothetical protein